LAHAANRCSSKEHQLPGGGNLDFKVDLVDGIDLETASRRAGFHQKLGI